MIGVDRISKHTHELAICVIHNSNEVGRSATLIFDFLIFETDYSHSTICIKIRIACFGVQFSGYLLGE